MTRKKVNVGGVPSESTPKKGKSEVTVSWNGGSRVYSEKVHGKDFMKLAKMFIEKHNGTIVE